jgi:hypothetical protein
MTASAPSGSGPPLARGRSALCLASTSWVAAGGFPWCHDVVDLHATPLLHNGTAQRSACMGRSLRQEKAVISMFALEGTPTTVADVLSFDSGLVGRTLS